MVEECAICYEKLSTEQSYTIAECGHTFHTHCIMSWYRCGHSRCPLCLGEGDSVPEEMSRPIMSRYREARFIARKKDTLPFLKRTYARLRAFEAKYTKHYQETKLWKNQVHDCAPREILKIHRQRRLRKYEVAGVSVCVAFSPLSTPEGGGAHAVCAELHLRLLLFGAGS